MFKSFSQSRERFLSAFVWALIAVIFWQAGGETGWRVSLALPGRSRLAPRVSGRWIS